VVAVIFGLYGTVMPFGVAGYAGGAVAGVLWALVLGRLTAWLLARERNPGRSANISLFLCALIAGALTGGGAMYILLFNSVLREPSATSAVLSSLMGPTVPFFIVLNSALEILLVPMVIFLNWDAGSRRRVLVTGAALIFLIHRIWTYLVYAAPRLETGTHPLSAADIEWYTRTLAVDYRVVLNVVIFALFLAAAFWLPRAAAARRA
jgi:hypothetical protein